MLCDCKRSREKVGLRYIQERRKSSANKARTSGKKLRLKTSKVGILTREESTKYLGQMITFQQQETTEIRNRTRAVWATFHKYRQELASKTYMLRRRLRLFDAVVSPTMSGTWTLTKEHEIMVQSTQRNMLRLIIQTKRRGKISPMKTKRQKTWVALKMKMRLDKVQTCAMIRTVTSISRMIPTRRLTQLRLKKKNG